MSQTPTKRRCLGYGPESVSLVGETNVDPFSFLWTHRNCSTSAACPVIESPVFHGGTKSNHGWMLSICPKRRLKGDEYCSVYLTLKERVKEPLKTLFKISILDANDRPVHQNELCREFGKKGMYIHGFDTFILSSALTDPARPLIENNTIKIQCSVIIVDEMEKKVSVGMSYCIPSDEKRNEEFKSRFAKDFGKMFNESNGTDVIISTSKTTFKAHTFILKARSPVFDRMLTVDMKEKESNVVQIADFDEDVVKGMLEHLYTGQTDFISTLAPELLQIADKYDLAGLKQDCEYAMVKRLNIGDAATVLVLADTHNAPFLKEKTLAFINLNKDEFLKTAAFQDEFIAHPVAFADLHLPQ
ncbi:Speckle-type POZ protein [Orchesella cincta]|uniref:Speckle-type POZ protein n=1 Tax=Orchesella cincta TaxID=48709 RepID=A0A1D2MZX3_ORCCI|nr:Speckle-type POZ protein [Orchesella cincta]